MSVEGVTAKATLRENMRVRLRSMSDAQRREGSARLSARLESNSEFLGMRVILAFAPLSSEPDVWSALEGVRCRGGRVAVPRWDAGASAYAAVEAPSNGGWVKGPHGAREPGSEGAVIPFERLDLVLVPGLAFDRSGCRLGRGRGYFDRILLQAVRARRWGIAWDEQVVSVVPTEAHDMNLDAVVTPGCWIRVTARG